MKVTDKYVFFCKGILGNWAKTPMTYDGDKFFSSEQLFMYLKAILFKDDEMAEKILHCHTSRESKDLGRQVRNFDQDVWNKENVNCMRTALQCKFNHSEDFRETLYAHRDKTFVECNPEDRIWAIGLCEDDPRVEDESKWRGTNLLGKILTSMASTL